MDEQDFPLGLTFDDVLVEPRETAVVRSGVTLDTNLTKKIKLKIPIVSSAMDTVSESEMATSLGRLGGIAILHRNCPVEKQVAMVERAKKARVLIGAAVGAVDVERA